ncbi:Myb transcription factor phl7 [Datura stramonium]|uniref:Myb transcription factor phl7 n=1 Tax=Datura stramonium TaxID=4076 RepID=A0ABS8TLZ0_DATST|nr:Myb transcription factor phl7 [Datura stramonium]
MSFSAGALSAVSGSCPRSEEFEDRIEEEVSPIITINEMYQPKGVPSSSLVHKNAAVNSQSLDCGGGTMDPINGSNNNPSLASKQRATPKGVLRVMGVQGLTIYHVKSHLQKYRLAKYLPDSSSDGKNSDKKEPRDMLSSLDGSSGVEITTALKLQMEVQKRLHEQLEVQKQLQLRIEAQGKYLKKIIEEQQRLSGVLSEVPGSGVSAPPTGDNGPESDNRTDPGTPAPSSESPHSDKPVKAHALTKRLSMDESFSSPHEPLSPDSDYQETSPMESPKGETSSKKQRVGTSAAFTKDNAALPHQILESSLSPPYQQPHSVFMTRDQFNHTSGLSLGIEDQKVSGSNI